MAANLHEMAGLTAWVETVVAAMKPSAPRAYAVRLCLEELVVNVILHAAPRATTPLVIDIAIRPAEPDLQIVIEDNGAPFDPTQVEPPDLGTDLSSARIGGRGLMLVQKFAQAVHYSRIGDRNRVVLDFAG